MTTTYEDSPAVELLRQFNRDWAMIENANLDPVRTKQAKAKVFIEAKQKAAASVKAEDDAAADKKKNAHSTAVGTASLTAGVSKEAATAIIRSMRDADDRAAKYETADAASAALDKAELNQDEPLARAIADRALKVVSTDPFHASEWSPVLAKYGESRPKQAEAIDLLLNDRPVDPLRRAIISAVPTPPEFRRLSDYQLQQMAEGKS
jgi:hypothetical protein